MDEDLHEMGVKVRTEVYGLFAAALNMRKMTSCGGLGGSGRVWCLTLQSHSLNWSPSDATDERFILVLLLIQVLLSGLSTGELIRFPPR